jgi:pimeloyl-ACP methyl ester carboxylesterase
MPGWCAIRRQSAPVRTALRLLAAVVVMPVTALHAQRPPAHPRTYVIVHAAWGGGWDWRAVDSMLTRRGNRVVRVTLTWLGERSHLASPEIGLSTHIDDVVNTILWESLHDVILVGHSYGGMVITGTADRNPRADPPTGLPRCHPAGLRRDPDRLVRHSGRHVHPSERTRRVRRPGVGDGHAGDSSRRCAPLQGRSRIRCGSSIPTDAPSR